MSTGLFQYLLFLRGDGLKHILLPVNRHPCLNNTCHSETWNGVGSVRYCNQRLWLQASLLAENFAVCDARAAIWSLTLNQQKKNRAPMSYPKSRTQRCTYVQCLIQNQLYSRKDGIKAKKRCQRPASVSWPVFRTDRPGNSKLRGFKSQKAVTGVSLYTVSGDERNPNWKVYIDQIVVSGYLARKFGVESMTRFPGALR